MSGKLSQRAAKRRLKISPVFEAITLALLGFTGLTDAANAAAPVSSNWFSSAQAVNSARSVRGGQAAINTGIEAARLRQQAAANQTLARSVANLGRTAAAIAAQQAAQKAARDAQSVAAGSVPDGIGKGGLWDRDANGNQLAWHGADRAVQTQSDGKTTVAIRQTSNKAILNWDSFNVGRNTTVDFQQNSSDAVLNRVVGADTRPSQIQGAIKGDGTVMVVNQNGVVFSGSSQVNVRNLVVAAAKISDEQFTRNGLYVDANGTQPTFSDALGNVVVERGAQITTGKPASSTADGGYALLLGANVQNSGQITTPSGQTALAAGDSFYIRKGVGTEANVNSTTAGNEVSTLRGADSQSGRVENSGLITAATGDITLTGHEVVQNGVAVATTSTSKRGTVHLSTRASDATGSVTLGSTSTTAVLVDKNSDTAYDSQRDTALKEMDENNTNPLARGNFDNLSTLSARRDLSRIEIVSGNTVNIAEDSLTVATGGEIAISAAKRTLMADRATLDVAGATGVVVAMESNNVAVEIQGNEQRDSANNRDSEKLNNSKVWVDKRNLVFVPAGTNGYSTDRWYTAGGLLEVSGYLATSGHAAGEWLASGGTVIVSGGDLVTRTGSEINLSGGTLDVQSGWLRQSWLKGSDGRLYELSRAPGDLLYEGLYQGYQLTSSRWGQTNTYFNPLIGASQRYQPGYTVGRDAGKLVVATRSAVLDGTIVSDVYQGDDQTQPARSGVDGYNQSHYAVARAGELIVGQYTPIYDLTAGMLRYNLAPLMDKVTLKRDASGAAQSVQLDDALADARAGSLLLDSQRLSEAGLGAVRIAAGKTLAVEDALSVNPGGEILFYAPEIDVAADLTANGGAIQLGNVLNQIYTGTGKEQLRDMEIGVPAGSEAGVRVHEGVTLDASGTIGSLAGRGTARDSALAWTDGGTISLRSTGSVQLENASLLDVSSGAVVNDDGSVKGGKGGNVRLGAGLAINGAANSMAQLKLDGTIAAYGVRGGGKLDIESASAVSIGGKLLQQDGVLSPGETLPVDLVLLNDYTVKAGEKLPADYQYLATVAPPGEALNARPELIDVTLAADWTLPYATGIDIAAGSGRYSIRYTLPGSSDEILLWILPADRANGAVYRVPAGATILGFGFPQNFPLNYLVPADVFPNGIPVTEHQRTAQAGSVLTSDVVLKAGSVVKAGMSVARQTTVADTTTLDTTLFESGFADYAVRGHSGLVVAKDVTLAAKMPVLMADAAILNAGGSLQEALTRQLPELYIPNNGGRSVTQRKGASLTLAAGVKDGLIAGINNAGVTGDRGSLIVERGASVLVDPGESIALASRGSLTVDGLLQAKGGSISLLGPQTANAAKSLAEGGSTGDGNISDRAITLGEAAQLDASAAAWRTQDLLGRPYGIVTDGGTIIIGGTLAEARATRALASDAFVVIKKGAQIDASGTSAWLDVDGRGSQPVATHGGSIVIASNNGIYLDGTLRAQAGGANAQGGSLALALEAPNYPRTGTRDEVLALRELRLTQHLPQESADGLEYGHGALAVDRVQEGGFDALTLYSNGAITFAGDVDLALGRELRLYAGALAQAEGSDSAHVTLSSPYLLLGGISDSVPVSDVTQRPSFYGGVSTLPTQAELVARASLIEIKGMVNLGLNRTVNAITAERAGFKSLQLESRGDLRFVDAQSTIGGTQEAVTELHSAGDISLRAAQIYPASGVVARVIAGLRDDNSYQPDSRLTIARSGTGSALPAQPLSVFGSLILGAANIEQNGVLRAPMGNIILGTGPISGETGATSVTLGAGSVTSVSANGLVMPWGGTSDGVNWNYQGKKVSLTGVGNGPTLTLSARQIAVDDGAVLDLRGGGELRGAGFISGRGGSTDARLHPLVQTGNDGFTLPSLTTNPVYAIIPGYTADYAPAENNGAVSPLAGQRITLSGNDIPGLPGGTYTLLPSDYALMPGAFRVELNGAANGLGGGKTVALRNGSWAGSGRLSLANTNVSDSLTRGLIITPADVVRKYSQYNETTWADYVKAQAALNGSVRAILPADAKTLSLLSTGSDNSFSFKGLADFTPDKEGYGGSASLMISDDGGRGTIEILGRGATRSETENSIAVYADDLNAIGASRLTIGGTLTSRYETPQGKNLSRYLQVKGRAASVILREGAMLQAPEVFLFAVSKTGGITLESGAGINTIGQGKVAYDSTDGFVYQPQDSAVVAASNGWLDMLAPVANPSALPGAGSGSITIGACGVSCEGTTRLYSTGTLLAATLADFQLDESVRYGTRNLVLAVGSVNSGSTEDLAAAASRGALTRGLTLNQTVLDRLLQGDTEYGAPALERLVLTAGESFNFFGNVSLNTLDAATGKSRLENLVLSTPAIYGYGEAGDTATIITDKLTWAGLAGDAPAPVTGGRGTGSGNLLVDADVVEFGYSDTAQPSGSDNFARTILGFANVTFAARDRITANQQGSLQVYQSQRLVEGKPLRQGGDLILRAPLVTGKGGSVNSITAGGNLQLVAPASGTGDTRAVTLAKDVQTGAELNLTGNTLLLDTAVALPGGKFTATAAGDVTLADGAWLDLAGRAITFFDTTSYSWGGDVTLTSTGGNILQSAGSTIDLSAQNNNAGTLSAIALADGAGRVDLQGTLRGNSSGHYNAGGTEVAYREGGVLVRAQALGAGGELSAAFADLNTRLSAGGFTGERSFQLKRGDLTIGDELKAHNVTVSLDNGQLTVAGSIDASGEQVGSIRLAAARGVTLAGNAQLDAHGTVLRVDSYGKIIDSPNRAVVELDAGQGWLTLADGARIDLRHGTDSPALDGEARGTLALYAPRIDAAGQADNADAATFGDIAVDARGNIAISGAKSIALYGRQHYNDAPVGATPSANDRPWQEVTQLWLDGKHNEATRFMDGALQNASLRSRLAGLNNSRYADTFHLRPAIEVVSATPNGDLVVTGDLDLSGYRYASLNARTPLTGVVGSGEVGQLTLRAGGDLLVHGSITDGFTKPGETPDDKGWLLTSGVQAFAGDVVVPVAGVTLAEGTRYPAGKTLNYAITVGNVTLPAGTLLPLNLTLENAFTLPAGTVLAANVLAADGQVLLAAGTIVGSDGLALPAGAQLPAGTRLPQDITLAQLTWPKGVALPVDMVQVGALTLPVGGLIAAGTNVVLPDNALEYDLRPKNAAGDYIARSNWAVAKMLPAGSQSWSLRVVGGADLQSADSRMTREGAGNVQLADSHYMVQKEWENKGGPVWYWSNDNTFGMEPGTPFKFDDWGMDVCSLLPGECVQVIWVWADGNTFGGVAGKPVNFDDLGGLNVCEIIPSECVNVSTPGEDVLVKVTPTSPVFSVLRTGTGDLDIAAGNNVAMQSSFGVYTAGTQSADVDASWNRPRGKIANGTVLGSGAGDNAAAYEALVNGENYQAWYPVQGGNLWLAAGGDLTGDSWRDGGAIRAASASAGNWLWRQGSGSTAGIDYVPTAWWINFGTYTYQPVSQDDTSAPMLTGFTGFGTLGGGNLAVRVGGDAGLINTPNSSTDGSGRARSQGVVLAVGSSGRVSRDGTLQLSGGGDLDVRIGGGWNSYALARLNRNNNSLDQRHELYGAVTNLRGNMELFASRVGTNELMYGLNRNGGMPLQDQNEVRPSTPWTSSRASASGGLTLVVGDSRAAINSRGDLVLGATLDAGLLDMANFTPWRGATEAGEAGQSWFTLWTDNTALDLHATGGQLAFETRPGDIEATSQGRHDYHKNGGWYLLPGNVTVTADSGSIYYGSSAANENQGDYRNTGGLLLAPLGSGRIALLAHDSLYGGGFAISSSAADSASIATILHPAFAATREDASILSNVSDVSPQIGPGNYPLFTFGSPTAGSEAGMAERAVAPSRFYASNGDIIGLRTGTTLTFNDVGVRASQVDYVGYGPVAVRAGRDIVYSGVRADETPPALLDFTNDNTGATPGGNLIVHTHANDVSLFEAGRDILYLNLDIAGPGSVEISAGRNIIQNDLANLTSIGPVVNGDSRPGAGIAVQAGMGSDGAHYDDLLARYLDTANRAQSGVPLAEQPGKVVKTYEQELAAWLGERYGFSGDADEALAYFSTLAPEQQRIFARQIYFAELRAGGREFNDPDSPRSGSYLRGRNAIAVLFPTQNDAGTRITYSGDLLMYGASGIHTNLGGDIQILTPGGAQTFGVEGDAPPGTAGLITRGQGNIQLYSQESILLGQSRIMTTFGGDILAWSAGGDINAGRGSKTTVVYTPPRRVYDPVGNVTISPDVPSTGAGIATLDPIPEVAPGDVDLIAPLGTIDAGEAGIRVSGSVNVAALQVVNAANIQVKGDSAGIPVMATVNVGALTSASAAASNATQAAADVVRQQQAAARQGQRSSVAVQILGFGDQPL